MGGLRPCLFAYFRGGWGVQNLEKPAYIILERSLILQAYLLGFLFDWRTTAWCCSAGSLLLSFVMWAMKETPYWLVEHNR